MGYDPCEALLKLWQAPCVSARAMATTDVSQMSLEDAKAKVALLGCLCQSQTSKTPTGAAMLLCLRGDLNLDKSADRRGVQIMSQDQQLAKAKRMMVALNNKFKAKFAKQAEEAKASAAAPADGGASAELDDHRAKLAVFEKKVTDLEQALDASQAAVVEVRKNLQDVNEASSAKDAQIAELNEAVQERDAVIETAKEKYQTMGQKARTAVEERNA